VGCCWRIWVSSVSVSSDEHTISDRYSPEQFHGDGYPELNLVCDIKTMQVMCHCVLKTSVVLPCFVATRAAEFRTGVSLSVKVSVSWRPTPHPRLGLRQPGLSFMLVVYQNNFWSWHGTSNKYCKQQPLLILQTRSIKSKWSMQQRMQN